MNSKPIISTFLLLSVFTVITAVTASTITYTFAQDYAQDDQQIIKQGVKPTDSGKNKEKEPKDKPQNPNKPDKKDKVKNCNVKAQVKVFGAEPNSTVTTQLETLIPQSKIAGTDPTEPVTFNFQYKKGDITCPIKEELPKTVYGTVNGEYFSGIIKSLTGNNKITYELQGLVTDPEV